MITKGAEPLPFSLPRLCIAKIGEELAAQLAQASSTHPGELVA